MQMLCSFVLLYCLRKNGFISFVAEGSHAIDPNARGLVPIETLKKTLPLSVTYLLYMVVGMASIRGVSVPMYTALRRTTVAFTMVMEYFIAGQRHSASILGSVCIIVLGALIAGTNDLSFDARGYLIVFLSNLTTAVYLATISRLGKSTGLNSFGLMWCNGVLCAPVLLLWTALSGELKLALSFNDLTSLGFQSVMAMSCLMAFCLNYTIFLNTSLNSALTQTMCGNLKDLGTITLGGLLFGGLQLNFLNATGQLLGFIGSAFYAYCKLRGK
eukprot:SM000200S05817  [mRNA]  locus=s200:5247:7658:- [translate_table: standard]